MSSTFDSHLDEKYGAERPQNQRAFHMTELEAARVAELREQGLMLWEAIEQVLPELVGRVWVIRSADDMIVVTE